MKKIKLIFLALVGVLFLSACSCSKTKEYTITFDSNGGSSVISQTVKENETAEEVTDPTYEGYTFVGWYLNDVKFDFNTKITEDLTLKAMWTKSAINTEEEDKNTEEDKTVDGKKDNQSKDNNTDTVKTYTVTFNSDGGSNVAKKTISANSKVSKPTDPTKSGYKFLGWYLNGSAYNFNNKVTKNITLTAKWEKVDTKTDEDTKVSVQSVSLSKSSLKLEVNDTATLTATVAPTNATNNKVTWTSSNASVASVDSNGKVTAKKAGTAVITATADGKSATATVTVVGYKIAWYATTGSVVAQERCYIEGTDGNYYSGTIKVTYNAGDSQTYNITADGKQFVRTTVSDVEIISVNK